MPQVPTYGGPQASTSSASGARFSIKPVQDAAPEQMQRLGGAMEQAGATLNSIEVDMQQQVNQVRVDDGLNRLRQSMLDLTYNPENGYKVLKGDSALTRPDGKALPDEYGERFKKHIDEVAGKLSNEVQRETFNRQAGGLMAQFQSGLQQHQLEEYRSYAESTQSGTIKLGMDEAKLNWQDPDKIRASMDSVKSAVIRMGTLKGWSGSDTMARMKETTSQVHMGVIDAAMQENNPEYALGYLDKYKNEMAADDMLKVRAVITKDVNQRLADGIATNVVGSLRAAATPTDYTRMEAITARSESGNRERGADGQLITSSAGAQGKMQVMPGTRLDPGYGVTPARDNSDAERTRVGREYLQAMVKNYSGDPAKAWAAYNWGPGNLDEAIKNHGANWLQHAPKETRDYVAKNLAALGSGAGVAKPTLQDAHDQVRAQIADRFGETPPAGVLKIALSSATQQFEEMQKADKAAEEAKVADAMRALMANGGHVSRLPYAVRSQIPPDKLDNLISFGQKIAKGDDITNPAVFQKLSDPAFRDKLSEDQFYELRRELSESDWQFFAKQRKGDGKPGSADKIESINMAAMNAAVKDTLASLGMDPSPKDESPEAMRLGTVKIFIKDTMLAHQRATGKTMTDREVEEHIKGLFAKSVNFRNSFMGIETGSGSQRLLTMKASEIPDDAAAALKRDFKAAGVADPSDNDLLGAYLRLQQMPRRPAPPAPRPRNKQTVSGKITPMKEQNNG